MPAAAQKPDITEGAIRRWLRENYAIEGQLGALPGECDLNFRLGMPDGVAFVCKISSASVDPERLAAQNEVLALLRRREVAAVPEVVACRSGETLVPLAVDEQTYTGRVLSFVPGTVLAECAPRGDRLLRALGRTIGRLNRALAGYDHPAFHYRFDWDLARAAEVVEDHRDLIPEPKVRDAVERIQRDFAQIVAPRLGLLRKSVIHNDANDYNVLVEGERVTGLIDFGDMVHSHTIGDLAVAMAYAVLGADDIPRVMVEMAIGFHEIMPIEEEELAVLFPMLRMRLALSACMAAHQVRLRPEDPYLGISQEPIRRTLPGLLDLDAREVHTLLEQSLA